jgi:hypothetical protein
MCSPSNATMAEAPLHCTEKWRLVDAFHGRKRRLPSDQAAQVQSVIVEGRGYKPGEHDAA